MSIYFLASMRHDLAPRTFSFKKHKKLSRAFVSLSSPAQENRIGLSHFSLMKTCKESVGNFKSFLNQASKGITSPNSAFLHLIVSLYLFLTIDFDFDSDHVFLIRF